jgi:outer membrane protein, multidrug efflux system
MASPEGVGLRAAVLLALTLLSGCSHGTGYVRPESPIPASWPVGDAYLKQSEASISPFGYADVFRDARLRQLIEQALANNRDLRIAAANVAVARETFRIQRAQRLPIVGASTDANVATSGESAQRFSIGIGVTSFELDLFGRIASLSRVEQERYFATEAAARATRIALIGDIADAWITYATDVTLLQIARETAATAERSVALTRARLEGGIAPRTDLRQAEQILATARADIAEQRTATAQDANLLQLLVGAPVEDALLPNSIADLEDAVIALPAGLNSEILLRRPDVLQAEFGLRAANATIDAARAALFPRISLTGLFGFASNALASLFTSDSFSASAGAGVGYDVFSGGAGRAAVRQSQAQRDAALANYERTIQTAFRETADALARQGTIADQIAADQLLVAAAVDTAQLNEARYRGGIDSFLSSLDSQRALYSAQRTLAATRQLRAANMVALYRALGNS